jgi:Tol biopolymer transport system component
LTSDGAGNTTPDFSPDGTKIVFRSNRDGGGIYEIAAFGGEARLLARQGLNPKFSPDGSQVAYWIGAPGLAVAVRGTGSIWVVPVAGGQPRQVGATFTSARQPIWAPDGKHLLFVGYTSSKAFENSQLDWWLAAIEGEAVKTGTHDALVEAGLRAREPGSDSGPMPSCWSVAENGVIFSVGSGNTNLWKIGISAKTGKVIRAPERVTTGAGNEGEASCSSGAISFTNMEFKRDVWLLQFDLDRGTARSALERLTQGPANRVWPSLSKDGRFLTFTDQTDGVSIWRREFATGKESLVARPPVRVQYSTSNASGDRIAFSMFERDRRLVYVSARGGAPEKLCEDCLRATDWSLDEKTLLMFGGSPYQINLLDLASHQQTPLVKHPEYYLLYGRFSPDNRWISFTARVRPDLGRVAIAPIDEARPVPESAWITIADAATDDFANWSPDGMTLYFTSSRDGYGCLWGQRIDAKSRRPLGEPFAVQHFHGRVSLAHMGWMAAGGRIALALIETTGNIWMMSRSVAR